MLSVGWRTNIATQALQKSDSGLENKYRNKREEEEGRGKREEEDCVVPMEVCSLGEMVLKIKRGHTKQQSPGRMHSTCHYFYYWQ